MSLKCNEKYPVMAIIIIFSPYSSLNENKGITDGHIAVPIMLQMNVLLQSGVTPTKLE